MLRSPRPPIELERYRATYQRTRRALGVIIPLAALALASRFDSALVAVGGVGALCLVILLHALVRSGSTLLEMVLLDTVAYLGMAIFVDSPETTLFVAMAQTFIVFHFVRSRFAVAVACVFMFLGWVATVVVSYVDFQVRTPAESVFLAGVVVLVSMIPVVWTQLQAGAEMHRLRNNKEQLAADKDRLLTDKDRFVASVSHELRTPLAAVVGLAHTLADSAETLTSDEQTEFVSLIVDQSEEVASIVDDLLVTARAGSGQLPLVVGEVNLAEEIQRVASTEFALQFAPTEPVVVVADPIRVRQILRNLTSNTIRYGGESKRITLRRQGVMGVVSVDDNGTAIPEDHLASIFAAFGRAHDRPGQTDSVGLGLTVSRQLAQMMGGDVIYSHDGKWGSFQLTLPMAVTATTDAMLAAPELASAVHRVSRP
ncbi:MAG: HAMP domain-containing histidine kinase [bacterium]|nr:HAMP domain-containing histidine kinase [bacterium]